MSHVPQYYPHPGFPPPRRQRVFEAGAVTKGDWITVAAYIIFFILGGAALITLIPGYFGAFPDEESALFGINMVLYTVFFVLAMLQCGPQFFESFATMRYYPWAKWLMLPGGWLITVIFSAIITTIAGGAQTSVNQQTLVAMTGSVPLPVMFVITALFGPFVEEYLFRHLLIGKLSRKMNIWVCALISTVLFTGIHFANAGGISSVAEFLPYVMLGVLMSVAYILSGKSLAYAYMLHVVNNGIALLVVYTLTPILPAAGA
ncbi:CPBP family intramembrane metalloprotease [Glutamicibacter sp. MNS18]|uniref:CPBP family intramembrane glutamic endopeptidase n=1 Tax=Glutamicibacter sp. MNS18 TaxID=2989817 RepID=UPI0022365D2B|nr:type II CAAX endopeptidase family protein [Glutamicibacter sp. MNS18]MCW4465443.1 CPBP family intramembrane metalloprotease [Glutamicibacter sp. MNS18]